MGNMLFQRANFKHLSPTTMAKYHSLLRELNVLIKNKREMRKYLAKKRTQELEISP